MASGTAAAGADSCAAVFSRLVFHLLYSITLRNYPEDLPSTFIMVYPQGIMSNISYLHYRLREITVLYEINLGRVGCCHEHNGFWGTL